MICTAAASESSRLLRSSPMSAAASSMRWRSHSTSAAGPRCASTAAACRACPTCRTSVSRRSPSATPSSRPGRPVPVVTASSSAATPLPCSTAAQRRSVAPSSSSRASASALFPSAPLPSGSAQLGDRPPEEAGQRRVADPDRPRLLQRVQQRQPLPRGRGAEDARGAREHRGHPDGCERVAHHRALVVRADEDGDVAGPQRVARRRRARGEQRGDVRGHVAGDQGAGLRSEDEAATAARQPVAGQHPHSQRCVDGRTREPRHRMGRLHLPHDDPRVAERRAPEHGVQGAQQPGVAAPVAGERGVGVGLPDGVEVAHDVRAAEGVDRLLGVADEDQRDVPREVPQDAPLQRVGVLELVDEHHPVAGPQPLRRLADGVAERVVQAGDEVVVGVQAARPLAALDLAAHGRREGQAHRGSAARPGGLEAGLRVADRPAGQPQRLGAVERGRARALGGELAHVEVVDDLDDQVVHRLDEHRVGGVAGDAERRQHLSAELVRGRDGRGVELRERGGEPATAHRGLGVGDVRQQRRNRIGARAGRGGIAQAALGAHQPLADPLAQFLRGLAAEGDEQQLRQAGVALGDVPGGECGDRERLAGAGAGLEHGGAGGQLAADVERGRTVRRRGVQHGRHRSTSAASRGRHSRSARSPNRVGSPPVPDAVSTSGPAAAPKTRA